jgi:hypothetical protein
MPKEFYTEKDIEELAYEKAKRLEFQLITDRADNPPAAPVRPYLSQTQADLPKPTIGPAGPVVDSQPKATFTPAPSQGEGEDEIEKRIRSAVIARLGSQVDAKLLDTIIHRVVKGVGLK